MKKMSFVVVAALAVSAFVSCDKDRVASDGGSRNSEVTVTATAATAYFKGVGTGAEYDMYLLSLQSTGVELTDNGYKGVGIAFLIDMNTPSNGGNELRLVPGTYSLSKNSQAKDYVFYEGSDEGGTVSVSYVYSRKSEKEYGVCYPITGGSFTVAAEGSTYTVSGSFETSHGTFKVSYSGRLAFGDATSDGGGSGDGGDSGDGSGDGGEVTKIDVSGFKYGYADHYGLAWSGITVTDYADWCVYLGSTKGFDPYEDVCLCLDILTEAGYKEEIPVGEYVYIDEVSDETVAPFKLVYGDEDSDGYCYGTWYWGEDPENDWFGATDGYVTVSKDGGKYHFDVNFVDSYYNGEVTGSITLESLVFSDESSSLETAAAVKSSPSVRSNRAAGRISLRNFGAAKPRSVKSSDSSVPAFILKNSAVSRQF